MTVHQALRLVLDLKKSAAGLDRGRLQFIEIYFEIVHRPKLYLQAVDSVSRLRNRNVNSAGDEKDVNDDISTYYILRQESFVCSTSDDDYSLALAVPTPKDLLAT